MSYIEKTFLQLRRVMEDPHLTALDKNVFTALLTFAGSGKIFPAREQICKRLGRNRKHTISKALGRLKELGYITIKRRQNKSSYYEICGVTSSITLVKSDIPAGNQAPASEINFPKC